MKKILLLLLALSIQACGPSSYQFYGTNAPGTQSGGTPPVGTPSCAPATSVTEDVRILFMVDNSGSTTTTDPSYAVRKVSIDNFLADYGTKTNFTYVFGYFGGTTASAFDSGKGKFVTFPSSGMPSGVFFGTSDSLSSALNAYLKVGISGNTPYGAAFSALSELIASDARATTNHYLYAAVFMSDGQPTDVDGTVMKSLAQELTSSAKNVALSTLYFGAEPATPGDTNAQAISNLETLASVGGGKFVDSNKTTQLVISDLLTVPGTCPR